MPREKRIRNLLKSAVGTPEVHHISTTSELSVGNQLQSNHAQATGQQTSEQLRQQTNQHVGQQRSQQTGQQTSQQIGQQTSHQTGQQRSQQIGETSLQMGQQTTEQTGEQASEQSGQQTSVPTSESATERVQPKIGRHLARYWFVDAIGKKIYFSIMIILDRLFNFNVFNLYR